jgi:hypothetical protein
MSRCQIVPPFLLERIAASHPDRGVSASSRITLQIDARLRGRRESGPAPFAGPMSAVADAPFSVYTAADGSDLPGSLVRAAGAPTSGDPAVDEAYSGVEGSLALFSEVYARSSYDGKGAHVVATVHYEKDYDNAFWDGTQLVFGDGDGKVFRRFTKPVDVLGHEFTHAVTQYTANLTYQGQSGALNESISDAFGSCLKQRLAGQSAAEADWLIGEGIFEPSIQGSALRSMSAPGTAYDDPTLGKDPQVASMDDYVDTTEDNGGVHTNSGIPNKAFYLAATGVGGDSWDGAGRIWYAALTSGIGPDTDFAGFAAATVTAAQAVSPQAADAVGAAWQQVKVTPAAGSTGGTGAPAPTGTAGTAVVSVTRSGGVTGVSRSGQVRLGEDPRSGKVEALLAQVDLGMVGSRDPQPDRFVYHFNIRGEEVVIDEHDLSPNLHELSRLLLDD